MASQFSAFAPSGIRFTSATPASESIYETLKASYGTMFTESFDAEQSIDLYAEARCLGLAQEELQRAGNEANPIHCTELLPKLEKDWRVTVPPGASVWDRRRALAVARSPKGGGLIGAITTGLQNILGSSLISVVPQQLPDWGQGGVYPAPSDFKVDGNPGKFAPLGDPYKVVELTDYVLTGSRLAIYRYITGDSSPLAKGERLVIDPLRMGRTETVTIEETGAYNSDGLATLKATFKLTHESGAAATTAACPYWISYRRFLFVVVADSVLGDVQLQNSCHEYLRKSVGNTTQWALVTRDTNGIAGPFTIGNSIIGHTPIHAFG